MKQTAVEFLVEKLKQQGLLIGEPDNLVAVREAKEMQRQQIIEAFKRGTINEMNGIEEITSEQYYNETFKK